MTLFKNVFVISTGLLIQVTLLGCTNTSTKCYGVDGPTCVTHRLSCTSPLVIQIINTSYGYRPGCNDVIGLTGCTNTTCCNEKPGDCFISFDEKDKGNVVKCIGEETCTVSGFWEVSSTACGGTASAYSKIQYDCVSKGSSITTSTHTTESGSNTKASTAKSNPTSTETTSIEITSQPSRIVSSYISTSVTSPTVTGQDDDNTSDVGSIVGGIFGAIIIIIIVMVVVVFLYKRRKQALTPPSTDKKMTIQTVTPQYHVIDGPGTINNLKDTSGYDEIELDRTPIVPTTDNYDHVGDDQLNVKSPNEPDNYNHIETHDHSIHEDNYNHIGNNLSTNSHHLESDYNHINGVRGTFNDEDDYNHIGDNDNRNVITDDNYHHIGSGGLKVEGDYNHIGSEELSSGGNDHYNHIHDDNNLTVNQAHSNSNNLDDSEAPYNLATC